MSHHSTSQEESLDSQIPRVFATSPFTWNCCFRTMFFRYLPEDLQRCILRPWVLPEQENGRSWLKLLSALDVACCSQRDRQIYHNILPGCTVAWPVPDDAVSEHVSKDLAVKDLLCFGQWVTARRLVLRSLTITGDSMTNLIAEIRATSERRLPFSLPAVETVAWADLSADRLRYLIQLCPGVTSVTADVAQEAFADKMVQKLWGLKRLSLRGNRVPCLSAVLRQVGPGLEALNLFNTFTSDTYAAGFRSIAFHSPNILVLRVRLPGNAQGKPVMSGRQVIQFVIDKLPHCQELVAHNIRWTVKDAVDIQQLRVKEGCKLKRICFPAWQVRYAQHQYGYQRLFLALMHVLPHLQYVEFAEFIYDLSQRSVCLLEDDYQPDAEGERLWTNMLAYCSDTVHLTIKHALRYAMFLHNAMFLIADQLGPKLLTLKMEGIATNNAFILIACCPLLEELKINVQGQLRDFHLEAIANTCKQMSLLRFKAQEPLFTDEGVTAVLKGCRQLKELALCSAPEVTSALMRVIVDERLMLRKIEFGGKGQITASHVRKFRRMAKKANLQPVPIVLLHSK